MSKNFSFIIQKPVSRKISPIGKKFGKVVGGGAIKIITGIAKKGIKTAFKPRFKKQRMPKLSKMPKLQPIAPMAKPTIQEETEIVSKQPEYQAPAPAKMKVVNLSRSQWARRFGKGYPYVGKGKTSVLVNG